MPEQCALIWSLVVSFGSPSDNTKTQMEDKDMECCNPLMRSTRTSMAGSPGITLMNTADLKILEIALAY